MPPLTHDTGEQVWTHSHLRVPLCSVIYLHAHALLQTQAAPSPPLCGQSEHAPAPSVLSSSAQPGLLGGWQGAGRQLASQQRAGAASSLPFLQLLSQPTGAFTQLQEQQEHNCAIYKTDPKWLCNCCSSFTEVPSISKTQLSFTSSKLTDLLH